MNLDANPSGLTHALTRDQVIDALSNDEYLFKCALQVPTTDLRSWEYKFSRGMPAQGQKP
jgi:hypothetical protein